MLPIHDKKFHPVDIRICVNSSQQLQIIIKEYLVSLHMLETICNVADSTFRYHPATRITIATIESYIRDYLQSEFRKGNVNVIQL